MLYIAKSQSKVRYFSDPSTAYITLSKKKLDEFIFKTIMKTTRQILSNND